MTEAEYQQKIREFVAQLEHYPKLGVRPFGYPKFQWWLQTLWIIFGTLLFLPLILNEDLKHSHVIMAIMGIALTGFAFTMRVVAFTSAVSGAVDRWTILRLMELEKRFEKLSQLNKTPGND